MCKNLNNKDFKNGMEAENSVLLDVRTTEEFNAGHLVNAINIDIMGGSFPQQINELDKSKNYYVYCRSGGRSASACGAMASWGFGELNNLGNGIMGWDGEIANN